MSDKSPKTEWRKLTPSEVYAYSLAGLLIRKHPENGLYLVVVTANPPKPYRSVKVGRQRRPPAIMRVFK